MSSFILADLNHPCYTRTTIQGTLTEQNRYQARRCPAMTEDQRADFLRLCAKRLVRFASHFANTPWVVSRKSKGKYTFSMNGVIKFKAFARSDKYGTLVVLVANTGHLHLDRELTVLEMDSQLVDEIGMEIVSKFCGAFGIEPPQM